MLISLRSDHKEHLEILSRQPTQVIVDFCKLAIEFLQSGPNLKKYSTAANKLNVDIDIVQNCIYGLINLLIESCKHKLSGADFRDSVLTLGFSEEQQDILSKLYESQQSEIYHLKKITLNEPHYNDLQWRFEVQVASRSLLHQVTPLVTMDLSLKVPNIENTPTKQHILLQTDPNNLLHLTNELEKALNESKTRHSRKVQRALNST